MFRAAHTFISRAHNGIRTQGTIFHCQSSVYAYIMLRCPLAVCCVGGDRFSRRSGVHVLDAPHTKLRLLNVFSIFYFFFLFLFRYTHIFRCWIGTSTRAMLHIAVCYTRRTTEIKGNRNEKYTHKYVGSWHACICGEMRKRKALCGRESGTSFLNDAKYRP